MPQSIQGSASIVQSPPAPQLHFRPKWHRHHPTSQLNHIDSRVGGIPMVLSDGPAQKLQEWVIRASLIQELGQHLLQALPELATAIWCSPELVHDEQLLRGHQHDRLQLQCAGEEVRQAVQRITQEDHPGSQVVGQELEGLPPLRPFVRHHNQDADSGQPDTISQWTRQLPHPLSLAVAPREGKP